MDKHLNLEEENLGFQLCIFAEDVTITLITSRTIQTPHSQELVII